MSFYYLSTPYSKFPRGINAAFEEACRETALLVRHGVPVFSPIAMTHPVALHGDLDPFDHTIWLAADHAFMQAAKGLIVCELEGWEASYGVRVEIDAFRVMGKPIYHMTPGLVPLEVLPVSRRVLGFSGYARAGKNAAAECLVSAGWTAISFADPVREALYALNPIIDHRYEARLAELADRGWDDAKRQYEVRQLLQRMGTEAGRAIHGQDCWVKIAQRKVEAAPGDVVITDVRFPDEAAAIRAWGGTVIRIDKPGVGPVNGHASERLEFEPDAVITNDGTLAELHAKVRAAVSPVRAGP